MSNYKKIFLKFHSYYYAMLKEQCKFKTFIILLRTEKVYRYTPNGQLLHITAQIDVCNASVQMEVSLVQSEKTFGLLLCFKCKSDLMITSL